MNISYVLFFILGFEIRRCSTKYDGPFMKMSVNGDMLFQNNDLLSNNYTAESTTYAISHEEVVNISCEVNNLNDGHHLFQMKKNSDIIKSFCTSDQRNKRSMNATETLVTNATGFNYSCILFFIDQACTADKGVYNAKAKLAYVIKFVRQQPPDNCVADATERKNVCTGESICITDVNKGIKLSSVNDLITYRYSEKKNVTLECHINNLPLLTLKWTGRSLICERKKSYNLKTVILLSLENNNTVFICTGETGFVTPYEKSIKFLYLAEPPTTTIAYDTISVTQPMQLDKQTENGTGGEPTNPLWYYITAGFLIVIAVLGICFIVLNMIKKPTEDKRQINPVSRHNSVHNVIETEVPSKPKLNETYSDVKTNETFHDTGDQYCCPYDGMYTEAVPKSLRKPNVDKPNVNKPNGDKPNANKASNSNVNAPFTYCYVNMDDVNVKFKRKQVADYTNICEETNPMYNDINDSPLYAVPQ